MQKLASSESIKINFLTKLFLSLIAVFVFLFIVSHVYALQFTALEVDSNPLIQQSVEVGSVTAQRIPNVTVEISTKILEANFQNLSSTASVFFSTSTDAAWTREHGWALGGNASREVSVPINPLLPYPTYYFIREESSTELGTLKVRSWIRRQKF